MIKRVTTTDLKLLQIVLAMLLAFLAIFFVLSQVPIEGLLKFLHWP